MKIRELLRVEVLGKKTSWTVLVSVVVVFGVAWLGIDGWHFLERTWLTPMERHAASQALASIDELRQSKSLNDINFSEHERKAKSQIDYAEQRAWTTRDQFVATDLRMYLLKTIVDRKPVTQDSPNRVAIRDELQRIEPISGGMDFGDSLHQMLDQ